MQKLLNIMGLLLSMVATLIYLKNKLDEPLLGLMIMVLLWLCLNSLLTHKRNKKMYDQQRAKRIILKQENVEVSIFQSLAWLQLAIPIILISGNFWLLWDVCESYAEHYAVLNFENFFIIAITSSLINMYIPYLKAASEYNNKNGKPAKSNGLNIISYIVYSALGITSEKFTNSERSSIISVLIASALIQLYLLYTALSYTSDVSSIPLTQNLIIRVMVGICLDILAGTYSVSMLKKFQVIANGEDTSVKVVHAEVKKEDEDENNEKGGDEKKEQADPKNNFPKKMDRQKIKEIMSQKLKNRN